MQNRVTPVVLISALTMAGCVNRMASNPQPDFTVSEDEISGYVQSKAVAGGGGGGIGRVLHNAPLLAVDGKLETSGDDSIPDRKIIQTAEMGLIVDNVDDAIAKATKLTTDLGGFIEKSESAQSRSGKRRAAMTLRVPQSKLEHARQSLRALGTLVESDKIEAQDVTRQFVDSEAHLRNYRAEEEQYLAIMRQAKTVKDTVEVAEKLSEVRGEIETLTADLKYLKAQVEMSTINVSFRTEPSQELGDVRWKPLAKAKESWHNMISGLAEFGDTLIGLVIMLPLIALWVIAIYGIGFIVWRTSKKVRSHWPKKAKAAGVAEVKAQVNE
jgi:uncharacterized protein DUF4349